MVKYDDVIQSHTMSEDEFKIQKNGEEMLEDKLMDEIHNKLQAIRDMMKDMKPSAEYRRISTITAAHSTLNHIRDEVRDLARYDVGKYNYELTEITNRLMEDVLVCNRILCEAETDVRKECDPWKYGMKEE